MSSTAFAALKTDGTVVTWGDQTNGGDSTGLDLTDIIKIYSTDSFILSFDFII